MLQRISILALHAFLGGLALLMAFLLRFDFQALPEKYLHMLTLALPVSVLLKVITAELFGLNNSLWRYASIGELIRISKAAVVTTLLFIPIMLLLVGHGFPRGIYLLDSLLTLLFFAAPRLVSRHWVRESPRSLFQKSTGNPTLILGAGDAGELAYRQITTAKRMPYRMVGFLDDDPAKQGRSIHGFPILGGSEDAASLIAHWKIAVLIVAIRDPDKGLLERMSRVCSEQGVQLRILPTLQDEATGKIEVRPVRELRLEDLLEREPVQLDPEPVHQALHQKRILVTGAGGSIGSELCRQIARMEPASLCLLDLSENALFEIEQELLETCPDLPLTICLTDIREWDALERTFNAFQPEIVFHAAACKHVPMMELHPAEAVRTNVFGTRNVLTAARKTDVQRFLLVSTDKAASPVNVMGATKWLAEQLVRAEGLASGKPYSCVRFGNVLGSRGSVVPLFERQIARGGPVRVTDPDATRYFMTIPEAVQLILQADTRAQAGDVFILDMGQPVSILALAKNLIRLSGYTPGRDMEIEMVGLRPGERLHEQLASPSERLLSTPVSKLNRLDPESSSPRAPEESGLENLKTCLTASDTEALIQALWTLVPAS